jgi:hypothetical protein
MKLTGENRRTRGKTCPNATLSTINPTWTKPVSNPGLRGGRPAANRLSHGTAYVDELQEEFCTIKPKLALCVKDESKQTLPASDKCCQKSSYSRHLTSTSCTIIRLY